MSSLKYVFAGILGAAALWTLFKGPRTNNTTQLGLDQLLTFQAQNFPTISPFVDFNPKDMPPRAPGSPVPQTLPHFAEALEPEEWLAYNAIPTPDGQLDQEALATAFAKQLGRPWRGWQKMTPYQQVLLAAFCLKAARKRDESDDMLGDLSLCWRHKTGLRLSGSLVGRARKILRNKDISGNVFSKCNQHAFETTAMMRALLTAREEGGVLAPAQFVWLRGHDRSLWYALNNLGRQAFHMEALGAMTHFKAEKMTQRPIPRAKVDDAIKTLVDYMNSDRARPIPPLAYDKGKRGVKKVKGSA